MATDDKIEVQISANTKALEDGFEKGKAEVGASSDQIAQTVQSSMSRVTQAIQEAAARAGEGFAKIGEGIKGVGEEAEALNSKINSIKEIGSAISELALAGLGLEFVADKFEEVAEHAEELEHLSMVTGIETSKLSDLQGVAKLAGISLDESGQGMVRFAKAIEEAQDPTSRQAAAFTALGITADDLKNKKPDEVLRMMADAFNASADGSAKAAIASEIFGRNVGQWIVLLDQGSAGLDKNTELARQLGVALDENAIKKEAEFAKSINLVKATWEGFINKAVEGAITWKDQLQENSSVLAKIVNTLTLTQSFGTSGMLPWQRGMSANFGTEGDWDQEKEKPKLDYNPKGDKGSDSQVSDWQNQLDKMLFDQQKFGDEAKAIEEKFWKDKLEITTQGSDEYYAVMHKVYEAENQDAAKAAEEAKRNAQKAFEAQLSVYAQERSAAQAGSQQRIAIDQQELDWVKAHYPEQADAYQRILKQQTEDRQAAEKQREQIAEIEAQAEAKSAEEVLNRRGELLQQEFNENQISWRQLAAGETELENERYQIAYDGLQKRLALAQDNLVEQAKLNAQLEELESQHQDKIQKIDQQQQKNSMALSKQVYDQTSNDFDQVVAKFLQGKESMSTAWQQFAQDFNNIIDQMVAKLVTQQLFGGGGSGSGLFGSLFGAAAGATGSGADTGSSLASSFGGFGSLLSGLFGGGSATGMASISPAMAAMGGGLAQGGYAAPSTMYEVAENGPETLSVGGRTFLMMGASGGTVTPSVTTGTSGGGSVSVTNNFHMGGSTDTRTQSQIAASATRALQMANART